MKKRSAEIFLCIYVICCCLLPLPVFAAQTAPQYFSYSLSDSSAQEQDLLRLNVAAYKTEETAAGFRLKVSYNENKLDFVSTETSGAVKSGTMKTNASAGEISSVYVCNTDHEKAPKLSGTIVSFVFQVTPGAEKGNTSLKISADQVCDYDGDPLEAGKADQELKLKIVPTPSSQASLASLVPAVGKLEPGFSSKIHYYTLRVGSDVSTVEFQADASRGGSAKVSRKTLYAAGKDTQIIITVTSEDKTESAQYSVVVHRAKKGTSSVVVLNSRDGGPGGTLTEEGNGEEQPPSASGTPESGEENARESGQAEPADSKPGKHPTDENDAETEEKVNDTDNKPALILVGDRMPTFFTGILAAALCVMVGIAISLWLPIRPRRP